MKSLAATLALSGLMLAAPAALAQQHGAQQRGQQQGGQQAGQQGGQQQPVEQVPPQFLQHLAQQPELQQALKNVPTDARNAITKAAQAQGGQLIGVGRDTQNGNTTFEAQIARGGVLYEMAVSSDGKLLKWEPKTR
jgi:uncharacterized membrane protein YkoI